jgi:hypothetical protein
MPGANPIRETELNEARSKLDEGLKTCHALMEDYRTALSGRPVRRSRAAKPSSE